MSVKSIANRVDLAVFLPNLAGGGAERVMVMVCSAFTERGYRVALLLAEKSGPYLSQVPEGVEIVSLGKTHVREAIIPLARYLRDTKPKVLLSAMPHANMAALVARILARVSTRVIISERNTLSQVIKASKRPLIELLPAVMRFIYPLADGVIAVSRGVADDLSRVIGLPRKKIDVVYNPVVDANLSRGAAVALDHPWFEAGAPPVILAVGRLTAAKDHRSLMVAFARVRSQRHCRLVILGEGPLRGELEEQSRDLGVSEDVLMPGFKANPFNWMRAANVFALSSRHEGLPGVLIQAMACGTPVVSTDCPSGPAEILEDGRWGRLVPVGDAIALADALAATMDEEQHPDVAGRAAAFGLDDAVAGYARVMRLA